MAFADQANACVSTSTTPLDPHERLGPAGATPGVGNFSTDVRVRLSDGGSRDALTRLRESQNAAARAGRRAKAASTCPLAGTVKDLCRRGVVGQHPVRYRRLLYRLVALL